MPWPFASSALGAYKPVVLILYINGYILHAIQNLKIASRAAHNEKIKPNVRLINGKFSK
jgi:hypothetical protein